MMIKLDVTNWSWYSTLKAAAATIFIVTNLFSTTDESAQV